MKERYRVLVRRDPEDVRFWLADVAGLAGAQTSARSLATLEPYVRDVIVLAADLPDDAASRLRLDWVYHTGDLSVDAETAQLRRRRSELEAASSELATRTGVLARRLVSERRFSVREAAVLLGLSPARVDQLVRDRHDPLPVAGAAGRAPAPVTGTGSSA